MLGFIIYLLIGAVFMYLSLPKDFKSEVEAWYVEYVGDSVGKSKEYLSETHFQRVIYTITVVLFLVFWPALLISTVFRVFKGGVDTGKKE